MSIADQLKIAKDDLDAVYAAGKAAGGGGSYAANILQYVSSSGNIYRLFNRADFKGTDEINDTVNINVKIPNCPANLSEMFAFVAGLTKVNLDIPPDPTDPEAQGYNGYRFLYGGGGATDKGTSVLALKLPDGIKFSNFTNFARNSPNLVTIEGKINLSECELYSNPFQKCALLEGVEFMPDSIPFSISFADSPYLSNDSITSIINGLSTEASEQTLTVHPTVAAKITETDVTGRGWSLAY
jgi:hypothetical protein